MNGADIVASIALGAKFTLIGRAYLYGLMAGGREGVDRTIEILSEQIVRTMKLLGSPRSTSSSPSTSRSSAASPTCGLALDREHGTALQGDLELAERLGSCVRATGRRCREGVPLLDVKRLQVLLAVVELGSVTAAAESLMYTPSAVSQQLRRLEREVGQPLMRRHARGMSPTDAGLVLVRHARKVLRQLSAAEADLPRGRRAAQGRLVLGTFPTVASSFLPLVVHRFRRPAPGDPPGHPQRP